MTPQPANASMTPAPRTASWSDIGYYAPWGNLALYHKDFRYSEGVVMLGTLDGVSRPCGGPVR